MFLGIEIGGTKLQLGVGRGDGTLGALWRGGVDVAAGAEGIRRQIERALPPLLAEARLDRAALQGVGVGFGGPIDDVSGTVLESHQIAGWEHFPLADWVADVVGAPAVLANDADVAGLAEALLGAGKGLSPIFYVTIGSGIGGGLVVDGTIYRGVGRGAAEIGQLEVTQEAGRPVRLEQVASGWAIGRRLSERLGREATAAEAAILARAGDAAAQQVLDEAWDYLSLALCHVVALLCPRRLVLGGGVSLMGDELFFEPLRRRVAARVFPPFAECCALVPAALGEAVVVHGALALARQRFPYSPDAPARAGSSLARASGE